MRICIFLRVQTSSNIIKVFHQGEPNSIAPEPSLIAILLASVALMIWSMASPRAFILLPKESTRPSGFPYLVAEKMVMTSGLSLPLPSPGGPGL